jgi:hypothetical protein
LEQESLLQCKYLTFWHYNQSGIKIEVVNYEQLETANA